ncbi:MAG: 3'-5' exonuclease [Cyanobacteria bacterium]|nr:3'-5' exonuclease [Cyanobacteriota bacterium]
MQQSLFGCAIETQPVTTDSSAQDILNASVFDACYTVIDLETTGLNPKKNAITEITAIQFVKNVDTGKYTTLVKPTEPIPPEVEQLTGIGNELVQGAPAPVIVLSELCAFMGPSPVLVGHNVQFDVSFLREKLDQTGLGTYLPRVNPETALCTKKLAQKLMPGLPSYEGVVVATQCGVYNPNPHRAESDVRMSAGILFALLKRLDPSIQTVADLIAFQNGQ